VPHSFHLAIPNAGVLKSLAPSPPLRHPQRLRQVVLRTNAGVLEAQTSTSTTYGDTARGFQGPRRRVCVQVALGQKLCPCQNDDEPTDGGRKCSEHNPSSSGLPQSPPSPSLQPKSCRCAPPTCRESALCYIHKLSVRDSRHRQPCACMVLCFCCFCAAASEQT